MAKYSLEFKMKIVTEYLSGGIGMNPLSRKYGFKDKNQVRKWIHAYQTLGIEGLKRSRKNKTYSVEYKIEAITMYEASEKSYQDVANELGLNNPSLIARWRTEYHQYGIEGLSRKQGRPSLSKKDHNIKAQSITSSKPVEITDLELANKRIKELEYELKMQKIKNEYLELLRSLRLEKKRKTRQESSTSSEDKKNTP